MCGAGPGDEPEDLLLSQAVDLNDISGDGIRLLNSIHPSDGRTRPGFQSGRGWSFLLE